MIRSQTDRFVALNSTKAPFLGAILLCVPRRPRARAEGTIPYSSGAVESKPWCPMICDCGRIRCPGTYRAASSPALIRQTLSGGILLSPFRNLFYSAGLNSAGIRLTVIRKLAYSRKCAPKLPLGVSANNTGRYTRLFVLCLNSSVSRDFVNFSQSRRLNSVVTIIRGDTCRPTAIPFARGDRKTNQLLFSNGQAARVGSIRATS